MSIINDALKKAITEKERTVSTVLRTNIEKTMGPEILERKKSFNWGPVFVVMVLLLIVGPILVPFVSSPFRQSALPTEPRMELAGAPSTSSTQKAQFGVEEAPLFRREPPALFASPYLNLTGIMMAPEGSFCIINEKVLRAGDKVQGAVIKEIRSNKVSLEYKGQAVQLYIAR